MNAVDMILTRSITAPFYSQHAGAFLFLFFLLFGIQPSFADALKAHYYIILAILTSPGGFLIAVSVWLVYAVKTILYFRARLASESYDFIFILNAIRPRRRWMHLAKLLVSLLAPVWVYGMVVVFVAFKEEQGIGAFLAIAAILVIYLVTVGAFYYYLEKAKAIQAIIRHPLSIVLPKNLFVFLARFVFTRQFPALLIVKLASFFILYFFSRSDNSVFEDRMLWLIYLTALIGHSIIVYRCFGFMEKELRFYRNLPVKSGYTLISLLLLYCLILLPEAWALRGMAIVQYRALDYAWMLFTGPTLLLLLHCLLYTEDMKMEEFLKLLFGIWVVFIFFSLSSHHWIMPLIALVFSAIIFRMSYRQYEKRSEVEGLE